VIASLAAELAQRRVRGDPRAHERCRARGVEAFRDQKHVALVDDHVLGVASVRPRLLVLLETIERERDTLLAEHLAARAALGACPARIDDAAYADEVIFVETGCFGAS